MHFVWWCLQTSLHECFIVMVWLGSKTEETMMAYKTHVKRIGNQSESIHFMLNMQCISFSFEAIVWRVCVKATSSKGLTFLWMNNAFLLLHTNMKCLLKHYFYAHNSRRHLCRAITCINILFYSFLWIFFICKIKCIRCSKFYVCILPLFLITHNFFYIFLWF